MTLDGHELWKGMAAGAVGGLIASWAMNQFQSAWSKASHALQEEERPQGSESPGQQHQADSESEDATMRTAGVLAEGLLHRALTKEEKKKLGPIVHYSFGAIVGALYGVLSEAVPRVTAGDGLLFGTAVFAGADELGLWAVGLAESPKQYPISTHAQALASHCVYGVTTETVRKTLRHVW